MVLRVRRRVRVRRLRRRRGIGRLRRRGTSAAERERTHRAIEPARRRRPAAAAALEPLLEVRLAREPVPLGRAAGEPRARLRLEALDELEQVAVELRALFERLAHVGVDLGRVPEPAREVLLLALGGGPLALDLARLGALAQGLERRVDVGERRLLRLERLREALLVRAELLELGREQGGLDVGGALAVEDEDVRDVVGLDLRARGST